MSDLFSDQLDRVTRVLTLTLRDEPIAEPCRMFVLEGKRLRSRLLFASAARDYFFAASPDMVRAAAAIELVHAASLLHDDVVDHCDLRRGKPVFHRIAGVRTATLSGLHLVHLALAIVATLSAHARRRVAAVARHLSRGQFLEILRAHDVTMRSDERIRIMKLKTASVFGLSCELGGAVSGEDPEVWIRRRRAGEAFGMLFQIADDLDDIFAAEQDLGRPGGADLLAGVMSLPITCALETDARPTLLALFADMRNSASPDHVPTCREILRSSGALDRTFTIALSRANAARGHLVVLPSSPGTEWMTSLVEDTLKRCQRSLQ